MLARDAQDLGKRLNDALIKCQKWMNCTKNVTIVEQTIKIKILIPSNIQEIYEKLKLFGLNVFNILHPR